MKRSWAALLFVAAACSFDDRFASYCRETGLCVDGGAVGGGGGSAGGSAGGGGGGSAGGSAGGSGGSGGSAGGSAGGGAGGSTGGGGGSLPPGTCAFVSISNTHPASMGVDQCATFAGSLGLDGGGQDIDCDLPSISLGSTPTPGLQLFGSGCGGGVTGITNGGITNSLWGARFGTFTWWLVVTDSRGSQTGPVSQVVVTATMTEDAGSATFAVGNCTAVEIRAVDFNGSPVASADVLALVPTVLSGSGTVSAAGCAAAQPAFATGSATVTVGVRPTASGTFTFKLDGALPLGSHSASVAVP